MAIKMKSHEALLEKVNTGVRKMQSIEEVKEKIYKKLPEMLPGIVKMIIVHIIMALYHISMPPWVMVIKMKKRRNHLRRKTKSRR